MSNEEKRQQVADGLERRKADRARREAILEGQARQLRLTISGNHAAKTRAEIQKQMDLNAEATERQTRAQEARAERQARLAKAYERDMKAERICNRYAVLCLLILLMTALTRIHILISIALALGLAVFPAVDIYRLYVPLEEVKK